MKHMFTAWCPKPLSFYCVAVLIAITAMANPAEAMFLPAAPQTPAATLFDRTADLATIQTVLESRTIQQRLMDYGLSPEEALTKMSGLSDEQVHRLAANVDALQAGGRRSDDIIIILLLVLIIVILI